jgi:DNA modification methylase
MSAFWTEGGSALHQGDSLAVMADMPDGSVDSIVTSPEYGDQRKYQHNAERGLDGYHKRFEPFLAEMLRVLNPAGSLMLNLGVIMRKGEEHPYADNVLAAAREMGWCLLHRTIWHKSNPLPLSHPDYLTIGHEWVFWLAPSTKVYRGYDADTRTAHAEVSVRRINDPYMRSKDERYSKRGKTNRLHPDGARPTTIRTFAVGSTRGINHPAPMPLALAEYLVSLSCPPDGLVLDPFCGSGTTLLAARTRGRRGVGIDMSVDYLTEAVRRITEYEPPAEPPSLFDDAAEPAVDHVSPPVRQPLYLKERP